VNATTSTTSSAPPLTIEAIQRMATLLREADTWKDTAEWMRSKGFDPDAGGALVLPAKWRAGYPANLPNWVRFSAAAFNPTMVNLQAVGLGNG
jgi:hypothetical protein